MDQYLYSPNDNSSLVEGEGDDIQNFDNSLIAPRELNFNHNLESIGEIQRTASYREESLPLITFNNDTQKFEVNQQVKPILANLKGPVGVIAVAGQYRTGKSYLLNRMLLNRQRGFGVGPTINPCTKGLWIWGTPVQGFTSEGQPLNVLVVDSEGIGGLDEDNNHDMRIFSLAMLLSSYFLYNSVGSIDENALQNLSLVTNLTKHIQLKSSTSNKEQLAQNEEDDSSSAEELAKYMPSFMWVVRDFALQLCDEQGNDINSKEYLEKALQERGQDSKNEIRRHLKRFFKERECCTMIRPLTNEEELQNLEQMELEELRSEFVEQVMSLRRKVLNQIRAKAINNSNLDATQWFSIVEQYVNAINEGCVPNIHSSWTYICKQNASKELETAKLRFESELGEVIQIPMNHEDLENILKEQKETQVERLKRSVSGDQEFVKEYIEQLVDYIETKTSQLLSSNQVECRNYATELLTQLFTEFDQQIKQQQKIDMNHIDQTLKEVHGVYEQNALDFTDKYLLLADAKAHFLFDLLFQVSKKVESESELQRQLDVQTRERLEVQLREAKEDSRNERQKLEDRLRQAMLERSEMEANCSFAKEQYESLKAQKEEEDREYKELIRQLKDQVSTYGDEQRTQKDDFEEKLQEMQRHIIQTESEFDKEKALFEQKVEFLEKSLQEKTAKERELMSERQNHKTGLTSELKQIQQKYEAELKALQSTFEEEKERAHELENKLKLTEEELHDKTSILNLQESTLKTQLSTYQEQVKAMEATISALKKESEAKLAQQIKERDDKLEQQGTLLSQLESQLKETQELLKSRDHEFMKENAIKDQKYLFLEMQLQDVKQQLDEAYRQHEQVVKALKDDHSHGDDSKRLSPSKLDAAQQELQRVQEQYQAELSELQVHCEQLQEKLTETELQLKLSQADENREHSELRQTLAESEQARLTLSERVKVLEAQRLKVVEEQEAKYKDQIERLEDELEHKAQATQREIKEVQEKSEEALRQLKNFYEIEKETLEQRIAEERDKNARRMTNLQEEIDLRMRDELAEKDEEIECLQAELRESESRHQQYVTQMEHELSLKQQLCETLERQVRDSRERIDYLEFGKNSAFEKQIEHFEQQRQEYNSKIDKLQVENLEKDRSIAQLQHKLERMTDDLERRKQDLEQQKASAERERKMLNEKLESTKKKLFDAQDEAMKQKLEFGREQALSKQQIEFQNKKIEELQKQTDDATRFFDEKIKAFKFELQDEAQSQIERITSEKELWENKYEQKRRALKEIETSLTKSNSDLEKKLQNLQMALERLEEEKRQMEEGYLEEISGLNQQIQQLDNSAGAAYLYGSAHAEDVIKLKSQVQDLERELSDLQSHYDRDKALWEGKCQFLESQKETYKRDLNESQKKFEITLEQLQKRGSLDKDKMESNQISMMRVIEGKFKAQIREMTETHQTIVSEAQQKMKRLENELKIKNEQIQMEARGKTADYTILEKKVSELADSEKRLLTELEEVKAERDRRVSDYQRQVERDKEAYRQKLSDFETKAKESENRRQALMFEFEKERAKWQMERDNLLNLKVELTEQVEKLQLRKDQLLRENEKLRTESKGTRKYLFQGQGNSNLPPQGTNTSQIGLMGTNITNTSANGSIGASHHASTSATRYMVGKSMSSVAGTAMIGQAISKMKENHKYVATSNNRLGSAHSGGAYGLGQNQAMSNLGMDEEQVNIGSVSGGHTNNTTPVAQKHYNRYGN